MHEEFGRKPSRSDTLLLYSSLHCLQGIGFALKILNVGEGKESSPGGQRGVLFDSVSNVRTV